MGCHQVTQHTGLRDVEGVETEKGIEGLFSEMITENFRNGFNASGVHGFFSLLRSLGHRCA